MKIEVRDSGSQPCQACGSTPLLYTVSANNAMEAELKTALLTPTRFWQVGRKRHNRFVEARVDEVGALLRAWTLGG